jgi:hypothetical protein
MGDINMISTAKEAGSDVEGFQFRADRDVILDVADVLGRVGKDAIRSAGTIQFMEVFNCLATLRHVGNSDRYIAYERGNPVIRVTSWNNARLAGFMDLIVQGKVTGLSPNQRERESLRILSVTLRNTHEQFN